MKSKIQNQKSKIHSGITLVELMTAVVISTIVVLAIAVVMVDGQKAWGRMYGDVNSDVAVQSLVACKRFDSVVRQSSGNNCTIDPAGNWVEVNYYSNQTATNPDRYARFEWQNDELTYEYGSLGPKATIGIETLCENVSACKFTKVGGSVQMMLTLDDNTRAVTATSSNVMNNN